MQAQARAQAQPSLKVEERRWSVETGGNVYGRVIGRKKEWVLLLKLDVVRAFAFNIDKVKINYKGQLIKVFKDSGWLRDRRGKAIKPYGVIVCRDGERETCNLRIRFLGETKYDPMDSRVRRFGRWVREIWEREGKLPMVRVQGWIERSWGREELDDVIPLIPAKYLNGEKKKIEVFYWGNQRLVFARDYFNEEAEEVLLKNYRYVGVLKHGDSLRLEGYVGLLGHKIKVVRSLKREIEVNARVNTRVYYPSEETDNTIVEVYQRLGRYEPKIEYVFVFRRGGRIILYSFDHRKDGLDRILICGQQGDVVQFVHRG